MFGTDTENPLEPTATGNTLPFAANGLFRLPKHMVDDSPPDEQTLRPSPGMGMACNAIFSQYDPFDGSNGAQTGAAEATSCAPRSTSAPRAGAKTGILTQVQKNRILAKLGGLQGRRGT